MGKYIIEIEDDPFIRYECFPGEEKLYIAKGFKSLVFDENGLDKLTPYDESAAELRGAEKAWEFCRFLQEECDYVEVYGMGLSDIMNMSYQNARTKYEAWQKKKTADDEMKVGDEVSDCIVTGVVANIMGDYLRILYSNGVSYLMSNKELEMKGFKKTGRHFPEVAELLKRIGGGNDCTEM